LRDMLAVNGTLESMSLFGNGLGAAGCELLAEGLRNSTVLKSLDLGLNSLKDEGVVKLAGALEGGGLEVLNLSNNAIGTRGMKQIAEVRAPPSSTSLSLSLSPSTHVYRLADSCIGTISCLPMSKTSRLIRVIMRKFTTTTVDKAR
jgi:hypothetical protein